MAVAILDRSHRPDPHAPGDRIRVMIVDDSLVARTVLGRILSDQQDFEVVAFAGTAQAGLDALATTMVDAILLDLEMPGLSGLSALPALVERSGGARVLIVSSACAEGAEVGVSALRLGAADTLLKPQAGGLSGRFAQELPERLRRIVRTRGADPAAPPPDRGGQPATPLAMLPPARPISCIGIGSSTGGVHALAAFFGALPQTCRVPILLTQHLPPPFMPFFAAQLADMAGRPCKVAVDGMQLAEGEMILAPGGAHLTVTRTRDILHVRLERRPMPSGCVPSVDPMFQSIGRVFGAGGVGVVLSGMGRDGSIGAASIVEAGGTVLAQDAETSVVWGMPGAVVAAGLAGAVMPPADLARCIGSWAASANPGKGDIAWR